MSLGFPAKAGTVLRYNGDSYRDHAVSSETEGGIANAFEQNVIEAVCKKRVANALRMRSIFFFSRHTRLKYVR